MSFTKGFTRFAGILFLTMILIGSNYAPNENGQAAPKHERLPFALCFGPGTPERVVEEPGPTTPPPPPPATITYENTVKAILDVSCVACHRSGNALGGVAIDTYASAFANRAATVDSVEKNRMPTSTPLSAEKKTALRAWLSAGALEK